MPDLSEYPQKWVTNELPPRILVVKGVSAIDPDCLVAHDEYDESRSFWIIEYSGTVIGLTSPFDPANRVQAFRARDRRALDGQTEPGEPQT